MYHITQKPVIYSSLPARIQPNQPGSAITAARFGRAPVQDETLEDLQTIIRLFNRNNLMTNDVPAEGQTTLNLPLTQTLKDKLDGISRKYTNCRAQALTGALKFYLTYQKAHQTEGKHPQYPDTNDSLGVALLFKKGLVDTRQIFLPKDAPLISRGKEALKALWAKRPGAKTDGVVETFPYAPAPELEAMLREVIGEEPEKQQRAVIEAINLFHNVLELTRQGYTLSCERRFWDRTPKGSAG